MSPVMLAPLMLWVAASAAPAPLVSSCNGETLGHARNAQYVCEQVRIGGEAADTDWPQDPRDEWSVSPEETPAPAGTSFQLCGPPDPRIERTIEQLIAGHAFSVWLSSRGASCADLTLKVESSEVSLGRQSTSLSVPLNGGAQLSVSIVTDNGTTRVAIRVDG